MEWLWIMDEERFGQLAARHGLTKAKLSRSIIDGMQAGYINPVDQYGRPAATEAERAEVIKMLLMYQEVH